MNNDSPAPVTTDEEATEVVLTITPKQKLIAKIAGTAIAVVGVFTLGYRAGVYGLSDDEVDDLLVVEVDDDVEDD